MSEKHEGAPARPLALTILKDLHFWVPFLVLLAGLAVLTFCAKS